MNTAVFTRVGLDDLALIRATGSDARPFLQAQLTQDIESCTADRAVLAGLCTPAGRLLASFVLMQPDANDPQTLDLMIKKDIADAVLQRLRLFVLRARVTLDRVPAGIVGQSGMAVVQDDPGPLALLRQGGLIRVRAPGTAQRWWLPYAHQPEHKVDGTDATQQAWQAQDIQAGFPWVVSATQGLFIPQTLNFDLIDGLSFTKGCYPGQEVVARSHYRGAIKRRMVYLHAPDRPYAACGSGAALAATDIYHAGKACGRVVNAAAGPDGLHLLAEMAMAVFSSEAQYRLGSSDGPALLPGRQPTPTGPLS